MTPDLFFSIIFLVWLLSFFVGLGWHRAVAWTRRRRALKVLSGALFHMQGTDAVGQPWASRETTKILWNLWQEVSDGR